MHLATLASTLLFSGSFQHVHGSVAQTRLPGPKCTRTTVAILGGGMAGVTAAQTLANASITDFLILEYRDTLGGRVMHTEFGQDPNGDPYVIELGANWVQGLGSETTENPVWALTKKHALANTVSNYDSIRTYNETGYTDYSHVLGEYATARRKASLHAGHILTSNLQDMTARSGLALAGWRPRRDDMAAQAVEWWNWDWEGASAPETSSFVFGVAAENLTFNQFGAQNNLVMDKRGYSSIIRDEAATFLTPNDPRLWLNTQVTTIEHSGHGVVIRTADGSCVSAAYAIATFSVGVLQNHAVEFNPELPEWKRTAIEKFNMGTYTKIFLQFPHTFWPSDTEFFLYASPTTRGWYPVFQSLSNPGFLPGSHILFVTVVETQAYRVERQSDSQTKAEIMAVLREMFPDKTIPDPIAFTYPRWSSEPWAYGSYSNWPAGTTLEMHQNLRANVGRLWFAGEATSAQYFGFLHGALFEGREVGGSVAALLRDKCAKLNGDEREECGGRTHYGILHGTTPLGAYSATNGWEVNSTSIHA
ncbi:amine oxidase [Aspergillus granulosus]|uniref:Amine oxidase n=1 Tax=Aspergillus granulosus TaxID=176169 RepID=A0ABR4H8I5_9EURO